MLKKRFLCVFLAVVLVLSSFPATALADAGDVIITGDGTVVLGKTLQLGATVSGTDQSIEVTWEVSGNTEVGTTISSGGLLTVADIEGSKALTVTARSKEDSTNFGTKLITVQDLPFSMALSKNDLLLHYIFDTNEKGPNNSFVKDYSPRGLDTNIKGTVNASQWTTSGFNFLSANSNWIQLPASANLVNPQMTIIFRGTRTGSMSGNQVFFCGRSGWAGNGLWINNATNVFHNGVGASARLGSSYTDMFPNTSAPVEFAYSVDARTAAATGFIMKNGVVTSTAVAQSAMTKDTSTTYGIGANVWGPDEWMNNIRLNKYMVFNRKLTESEATEVYQGRLDPYKSGLNEGILSAMARNEIYYTPSSMDMLRSAIRAAKLVLKNPTASASEVFTATAKLSSAEHELVAVPGIVSSVTVSPPKPSINLAMTQQFSANVTVGDSSVPKTVEWSVNSTKSSITQNGLLTIASDEDKDILTVTATSTVDYSKAGTASVTVTRNPAVVSMNVTPQVSSITTGRTQAFTADVVTVGDGDKAVSWTVTGGNDSTISKEGLLTVGTDETANSLTVTAKSKLDSTKTASVTVSVYYITSVTLTPPVEAVQKGRTSVFSASVNGTNIPNEAKGLIWEVTGANSAGTSINSFGALTVDLTETATTLAVKVSSEQNPAKFAKYTVVLSEFQLEIAKPINGYYNTFKLDPVTAATYADNVTLSDWTSTGNWRTIANQTAAPVMSTNSGLTFNAGNTAWNIYSAAEALHIGSWTTYYRCVTSTKTSDNFAIYNGGKYSDIDYTIGMRINTGATSGAVVFRYQDYLNYYYVKQTVGSSNNITMGKVVNGIDTVLHTGSASVSVGNWYNLRVILKGDMITVKRYGYAYWRVANEAQITNIFVNKPLGNAFTIGYCGMWTPGGSANVHFNLVGIGSQDYNYTIANNTFTLTSGSQGNIKSLYVNNGVNTNMNFVSNEDQIRVEMGINRYLGELKFRYQVGTGATTTASTGRSSDSREMSLNETEKMINISYTKPSANSAGIKDFTVNEAYSLKTDPNSGDYVQFDIHIKNTGSNPITFKDISLPITWNAHWQADSPYENYTTHASNYVSYNSSYISVERGGGGGDKLVFIPDSSTDAKLEYRRYISTQDYYTNMPEEFFIYSSGIATDTANGNFDQGYLPHTSLTLNGGEEKTLSFRIFKTSDYLGINDILEEQGLIAPVVKPGMVMPMDNIAEVDLRTIKNIESVTDTTPNPPAPAVFNPANVAIITKNLEKSTGTHNIYNIEFKKLGRNDITVTYDGGKKTVLQFWIMEPLKDAIQRRADFIIDQLWLSDERTDAILAGPNSQLKTFASQHRYAFLEMNNVTGVASVHSGNSFYCSNSDYEQYYDAPDFLAAKNIYLPVKREIDALDTNLVEHVYKYQVQPFGNPLEGYLCVHCCNNAGGWGYGSDPVNKVERVYNYARVYNQFFSMYQIAKRYPGITTFKHEANWYLSVAAIVAKRGIEVSMGGTGAMGEQTLADMVAALNAEGLTSYAADIRSASTQKGNNIARQAYPFGSEFSVDNTGEEGAYFNLRNFSTAANRIDKMQQTVDKCLAWIGKTPVWYLQTTGRPAGNDWWMFQYAVGLQAKAYTDWFFNYADDGTRDYNGNGQYSQDMWRMVYPAKMSPFVHIQSGQPEINIGPNNSEITGKGVLGTVWGNIKPTHPYNWNQGFPYSTSAEADISLWAGIQLLSSDVVPNDPSFGLTGYGCEVSSGSAEYTKEAPARTYDVIPKDGLYRRLNVVGDRVQVELLHDQYTLAKIHENYDAIKLSLKNVAGTAHTGVLKLRGFDAGTYNVRVDNALQGDVITITDSNAFTEVSYNLDDGAEHELLIISTLIDNTKDDNAIVGVSVSPSPAYVPKGQKQKFTETVRVTDDTLSKTVTWSLTGAKSTETSINATTGELTVAPDETALTLTVKATSTVDPKKFGTSTVQVFEITKVEVTPQSASVQKGKGIKFSAVVTHINAPASLQGVIWSVEGGTAGTSIDTSGYLTVAEGETASSLTVKATPGDPSKAVTIPVTLTDRTPVTSEDLILHYKFDGSGGSGAMKDYSKHANDTTINGTINADSWSEEGFTFNGSNYIKIPSNVQLVNPEMTIVFKVKRTGEMDGSFFWGKNANDWASDGMFINTAEGLTVVHNGTETIFSLGIDINTLFPLNQWTEVAYSIDTTGSMAKGLVMVNGVKYTATDVMIPTTAKLTNPSAPYNSIGMSGYSNEQLKGVIMSKYMIFDRALTEAELLSVYNSTSTKAQKPIITTDAVSESTVPNKDTVNVTITSASTVTGSAIYYTTDGTNPTVGSAKYTGAFQLKTTNTAGETFVVRAIEIIPGYSDSEVAEKMITFLKAEEEPGQAPAPVIVTDPVDTAAVANDSVVLVTINSEAAGSKIYYTLDGSTPSASSSEYTAPFILATQDELGQTYIVNAIVVVPGYTDSIVAVRVVTFRAIPKDNQIPAPVISLDQAGPVANDATVNVRVISSVSGSAITGTIYYTTNGTTPTTSSTQYNGEFSVKANSQQAEVKIVKAIEIAEGMTASDVAQVSVVFLAAKGTEEPKPIPTPVIITDPADTSTLANRTVVKVSFVSTVSGSAIYFTTDGTNPTAHSTQYLGEFWIAAGSDRARTVTVKAVQVADGFLDSMIAEKQITFLAAVPTIDPTPIPVPSDTATPTSAPAKEEVKGDGNTAGVTLQFKTEQGIMKLSASYDTQQLEQLFKNALTDGKDVEIPIVSDKLISEIQSKKISEVNISVNIPDSARTEELQAHTNLKLPQELLTVARENGTNINVSVKNETGRELYAWNLDPQNLMNSGRSLTDINLSLSVKKVEDQKELSQELTGVQNALIINFAHDGVLPSQASVRVYVGDLVDVRDSIIYLYHYNPQSNRLETLPYSSGYHVDAEGYVTMELLHCSDYVIMTKAASNSVITSLLNQVIATPSVTTIYAGGSVDRDGRMEISLPTTLELVATLKDKTSNPAIGAVTVTYKSSNKKIATVDSKGKITAVKAGTVTIYTTIKLYSGKSKTIATKIAVKKPSLNIIGYSRQTIKVGESISFSVKVEGLDPVAVIWKTTKKSIVAIDKNGKATAVRKGTVYISAQIGDTTKVIKMTVK